MALELVANEDLKVGFTNTAGPADIAGGLDQGIDAVKVVPTKSTNCNAEAKLICTSGITLTWTVAGCPFTSALYTFVSGVGKITATALKVKADGVLVLREGDTGTCAGGWTLTANPFTAQPCTCNLEITDAGQTTVKAQ